MSSLSDDPTSDDGECTEPLAVVETTMDFGEDREEPDAPAYGGSVDAPMPGNDPSDELQLTGQSEPDEPHTTDEWKAADPSDKRVAPLVPKRGRPRRHPRVPKVPKPRGRPPVGSQVGPRLPTPPTEHFKSVSQTDPSSQPKTYSNKSNNSTARKPEVVNPVSTPAVQTTTPLDPPRPKPRGRPSLASQTPRMPGPASEFFKTLVNMHTCLKWERKVLYRYDRPASSAQPQNAAQTPQSASQGSSGDANCPSSALQAQKQNTGSTGASATSLSATGTGGNTGATSTPAQPNNKPSGPMAADQEEKEGEPVVDLSEENNVTIGSAFSLTDVPPDSLPTTISETSTSLDQGDSDGCASDGERSQGNTSPPAEPQASVTTYYLLGCNRGLNRKCVVPNCNRPLDPHFSFPKDKNLCLKWLLAIPKGNWSLNEHSVVCARHFDRMNINWKTKKAGTVTLTVDAVPKLFLTNAANALGPVQTAAPATSTPAGEASASINITAVSSLAGKSVPTAASSSNSTGGADSVAVSTGAERATESSDISETQDVSLVQQGNGVFKIEMNENIDDDSASDLEIIEPHIETYEVSDTSDEGEQSENKSDTAGTSAANNGNSPVSIVGVNWKKAVSSTGQLHHRREDGKIIRCCVPRCGSYTGSPPGVGFHTFPTVGETRLSVRSLDNTVTVHDLCSMWKSLLTVPEVTNDSYVCTRHFTVNDYIYNTLNKAAVPTQFLPTPVMFAPCRVDKAVPARPVPLVIVRNPLQQQSNRLPGTVRTRPPAILRGSQRLTLPPALGLVQNRIVNHVLTVRPSTMIRTFEKVPPATQRAFSAIPRMGLGSTRTAPSSTSALPPPMLPKPAVMRLGCAIPDCPNNTYLEGKKPILFKLPLGIEKCKEWIYACGHPEWLDKGMLFARAKFRICSEHFTEDMFLGPDHKMLKGFAKPCVKVQEPYKKCIVNSCHNYYDKERLHYIGVDFSPFPCEENAKELLIYWIQAVKGTDDDPTDEELKRYEDAVICSLHFRNSDYITGPVGKRLGPFAVPSMNLVVKDPQYSDDNVGDKREGEEQDVPPKTRRKLCLSSKRRKRRIPPGIARWREERRKLREAKEKALAEGLPWPPPEEEKPENQGEQEIPVVDEKPKRKKPWEGLSEADRKRYFRRHSKKNPFRLVLSATRKKRRFWKRAPAAEPGDPKLDGEGHEGGGNESSAPSQGKRGRGTRKRSLRRDSEELSENDSFDGSLASESDSRSSRSGKRARTLRRAVEDEDIYTSTTTTRASARAAAAKNRRIYAENSDSQQEDGEDQGVPDGNASGWESGGRPQGTHFLDPDFGVSDDMDTLENCLETVLEEHSQSDSLGPPDLGPPERDHENTETVSPSNQGETENVAEVRQLRFGRKARPLPPPTKKRRRRRKDVSDVGVSEETHSQPNVSGDRDSKSQPVGDGENTGNSPLHVADDSKQQESSKTVENTAKLSDNAGADHSKENVTEKLPSHPEEPVRVVEPSQTEHPSDSDSEKGSASNDAAETRLPAVPCNDRNSPPPGEKPPDADVVPSELSSKDDSKENDDINCVPYGPKMATPTRADIEFFRSILPSMAKFNIHQRAILKATVLATLKGMLGEDIGVKLNPTEALLNELPLPSCPD